MFFVLLFLIFTFILLLLSQYGRSRHKKLITITIMMMMAGIICWGYHEIYFAADYPTNMNKGVFNALVNKDYAFSIGMILLALSIPCMLFCLLSRSKEIREIDKPLEENDDLYG